MNELQKYGIVVEKKVDIVKFYEILCLYKDKGDVYPFEAYACTLLDTGNYITFLSPNRLDLVQFHKGEFFAHSFIDMDTTFKILNPYLRKNKIEKIKGM